MTGMPVSCINPETMVFPVAMPPVKPTTRMFSDEMMGRFAKDSDEYSLIH